MGGWSELVNARTAATWIHSDAGVQLFLLSITRGQRYTVNIYFKTQLMPDTWFTADFHLGHANIIRFCSRPFTTVGEMDQAILERLNASVKANDILYLLGDFCMGGHARVVAYRRRIRCQKIFAVPGNHDKQARKLKEDLLWLDNLAEVSIHGQRIVLCHYALHVWNRSNHGSWHLYGHSHGRLLETPNSLSMDVGVDTHDFRPWHYDEIADIMRKKTEVPAAASDH